MNREKTKKVFLIVVLLVSLLGNILLSYYLYENLRPLPSVIRFGFGEQNIVVYCERAENATVTQVNFKEQTYKVGNAKLQFKDDVYFISPNEKINLSQIGVDAFIINSDGKLLYQMVKPENESTEKEENEKVFVTPSGKKYHSDSYCAGRSAFETELETAVLFGRASCSICYPE